MAHFHHHHDTAAEHPAATQGRLIRWARHYDLLVDLLAMGRRARLRRKTVDLAHLQPGEAVLEVGCGTGDVALLAGARVGPSGTVHGIDPSPEMVAVAHAKARRQGVAARFQVGAIESLAFPDASFDVVLSSLMMHHLPDDLKRRGLAEITRVLRPGGRLVIVDFRRPTGFLSRVKIAALLHGGVQSGVQDLAPLLAEAGLTRIEGGALGLMMLGFVRGQMAG